MVKSVCFLTKTDWQEIKKELPRLKRIMSPYGGDIKKLFDNCGIDEAFKKLNLTCFNELSERERELLDITEGFYGSVGQISDFIKEQMKTDKLKITCDDFESVRELYKWLEDCECYMGYTLIELLREKKPELLDEILQTISDNM